MAKKIEKQEATIEEIRYWDELFVSLSEDITAKRKNYCNQFSKHFISICSKLLPEESLEVDYFQGWDDSTSLKYLLDKKRKRELYLGHTISGPHKSELRITANGKMALETLSRGEQRMLIAGIMLAQHECLKALTGKQAIFVLDDLGAELDSGNRKKFLNYLSSLYIQTFISAIDPNDFSSIQNQIDHKVFHVEHGSVKEEA